MKNIALIISYNGKNFNGWQKQLKGCSVQQTLEDAIFKVVGKEVKLVASGRTDAGVSAIAQVANFVLENVEIDLKQLKNQVNFLLPQEVRIVNCFYVPKNFSARHDAINKTYAYNFYLSKTPLPYFDMFATQVKKNVNMAVFEKNLNMLVGTYDFTSFCASRSQTENKVRTIYETKLVKNGEVYSVIINGNGFLYNMIRIIMGTLIDIASGKLNNNILEIINFKDRTKAGVTAPSVGLVLVKVNYNEFLTN